MHEAPRPLTGYLLLVVAHPDLLPEVERQLELIQPQPRPRREAPARRSRAA